MINKIISSLAIVGFLILATSALANWSGPPAGGPPPADCPDNYPGCLEPINVGPLNGSGVQDKRNSLNISGNLRVMGGVGGGLLIKPLVGGIGGDAPLFPLDVSGDINIRQGGVYKYDGVNVIFAKPSLYNFFFGNAGNLMMTGGWNTAVGERALLVNSTGAGNSAFGYYAGALNSTADDYMTFIGSGASRDPAVPAGTILTNSTAIGYYSKVDASNKIVLGNTAVTKVQSTGDFCTTYGGSEKCLSTVSGGGGGDGVMYLRRGHNATTNDPAGCPSTWTQADLQSEGVGDSYSTSYNPFYNRVRTCYTNSACRVMYLRRSSADPAGCPSTWTEADLQTEYVGGYLGATFGASPSFSNRVRTCYKCN